PELDHESYRGALMSTKESVSTKPKIVFSGVLSNWLRESRGVVWPLAALALILLVDSLISHDFFNIRIVVDPLYGGHYYGNIVDILKNAAPVMLLATGMSLVIATRG